MFEEAKEVLGYDLLDVCQNGPKSKLDNTVFAQPALFVCSMAAVEKFRQENGKTVTQCSCTAGLSLGEYTALVFAGVMSFKDALRLSK
jgi:[acyl-carrier-protein] S-malonyltransferase